MSYLITSIARFRMYLELIRNFADSAIVIFGFFFFGAAFVPLTSPPFISGTMFFCMYWKVDRTTPPPTTTAPIK